MAPPSFHSLRPAACLLAVLIQWADRCQCQLLQTHGSHETEIRLCNTTANIITDCVTPNHGLLTALVAILSCLLLLMICSMALPLSAQNRLLRFACSCGQKVRHVSYIDIGLYKTQNVVCHREVYLRHVRCSNGEQPTQQPQASSPPQQLPPRPDEDDAVAVCSVPIRIEPAQEEVAAASTASPTACQAAACWTELQCQHPALVCDSLFCYRSDPNIRQSSAPRRWLGPDETQRKLI